MTTRRRRRRKNEENNKDMDTSIQTLSYHSACLSPLFNIDIDMRRSKYYMNIHNTVWQPLFLNFRIKKKLETAF